MNKNIVDMKPTQIELLKTLKKLDNNLELNDNKKEKLMDIYTIFSKELEPINHYFEQLKNNKLINVSNTFLESADIITKLINDKTTEKYQIKFPKHISIIEPITLKEIKIKDIKLDDINFKPKNKDLKMNLKDIKIDDIDFKPKNKDLKMNLTDIKIDDIDFKPKNKDLKMNLTDIKLPILNGLFQDDNISEINKNIDTNLIKITEYVNQEKEELHENTVDTTDYGQLSFELDEAKIIIDNLIQILLNTLNFNITDLKFERTETILLPEQLLINLKDYTTELPNMNQLFDKPNIEIKGNIIKLDNDPNIELKGGTFYEFYNKLFIKKKKDVLIKQIQIKIYNLKENINKFNVLYIQYNYFLKFIIDKINKISLLDNYNIYIYLTTQKIKNFLMILDQKYNIISNPDIIFDKSKPSNIKNKILYFKHYYFIYILYNLFKKINDLATEKGLNNKPDYSILLFENIELSNYFMIFNLFYDLINN
jgi:hypothetical protein